MPQSRGKYEFYQEASLSQKISKKVKRYGKPIYPLLAGSDTDTSLKIGRMIVLKENGLLNEIPESDFKLMMELLDMERLARFATGQKVNEISIMGMQYPKDDPTYGDEEDSD